MHLGFFKQALAITLSTLLLISPVTPGYAAFMATEDLLAQEQQEATQNRLVELLHTEQARVALLNMGVAPEKALERVQRLTPQELAQLNSQLDQLPAGGSNILGVLVLIFVVFVITDMLGATDIFPFVHPINKK